MNAWRLGFVLALFLGLTDGDGVRPAAASRIAFVSNRDGNAEIYVMNADGTGLTRLSNDPENDSSPAWSPDGAKIAFSRTKIVVDDLFRRQVLGDIYVMNADGSEQRNLTDNMTSEWQPVWSPDGSRIAFIGGPNGKSDIYVMNADGSGQLRLTSESAGDVTPAWSPDGSRIAFVRTAEGDDGRYITNVDGTGSRMLSRIGELGGDPQWSPDSSRMTYTMTVTKPEDLFFPSESYVYVINADGTSRRRLTEFNASGAAWSPDGSKIVLLCRQQDNSDIYILNAEGTGVTRLTNSPENESSPAWSPDGSEIIYTVGELLGHTDIYLIDADGSAPINLTDNPATDGDPNWR